MSTLVPQPVFGPAGFIAPQESAILVGTTGDIDNAFGGGLNPALNTPQGQLASSMAAIIGNIYNLFQFYCNQVDPAFAMGRMQDAIGRIYYIFRQPGASTATQCTCTGLSGVVIPTGASALDIDGNLYQCTGGGTIPIGGSISLPFACLTIGPIPCPANTLNQIYQTIPGWDTINNPEDGVIGSDVEGRAAFELRRSLSTAQNSNGSLPSILGAVLSVPNVIDAFVTENDTGSPVTLGDITLTAHSLYVCVAGGASAAVAQAIWSRKAPGCSYVGSTSVTVYDMSPQYVAPYPSYTVKFQIAAAVQIIFAVDIINSAQVPSDAGTQIANAIVLAGAGTSNVQRLLRIAGTVLASTFYAPVIALGSWAQIIHIKIGCILNPAATFTGVIAGTAMTTSGAAGTIAIGQSVVDAAGNVLPGTVIVSGSGTSWVVNLTQTVSSETMYGVIAGDDEEVVGIDQIPVIDPANVFVTLT